MGTETPQRPRKEAAGSRHEPGLVRQTAPASTDPIGPQTQTLLEEVLRRENLRTALKRVQSNKGAPGVDGMRVEDLPAYLRTEWHAIREQRLDASYIPSPVREVRLPKPGGGTRMLKWSHWDSRLRVRARPPPPGEAPGGTRGASHMHAAVNNRLLAVWGLLNLLTQLRDLQRRT